MNRETYIRGNVLKHKEKQEEGGRDLMGIKESVELAAANCR